MSIASEITALTSDRNAIRTALVNQGITAASTHGFDDFATDIAAIEGGSSGPLTTVTETEDQNGGTIITVSNAVDLTSDTVTADKLVYGYTAHDRSGTAITGTYVIPPVTEKDVNFYDYDGTLLYSYSATDFANLTTMPALPSHAGLTAQEWNWSLTDAKTQVATSTYCDIGATYTTSDGKSRIYVDITDTIKKVSFAIGVHGSVTIDWGDGTTPTVRTYNNEFYLYSNDHTYASAGSYVITLTATTGTWSFLGDTSNHMNNSYLDNASVLLTSQDNDDPGYNQAWTNAVKKIELGANITYLNIYGGLGYLKGLETINIPNTVVSINYPDTDHGLSGKIGYMAWCTSLKCVIIPNGITQLPINFCNGCRSLEIVSIPNTVTDLVSQTFYECPSLKRLVIPNSVESIGQSIVINTQSLAKLILPSSSASIADYAFEGSGASEVVIPSSITSLGDQLFNGARVKKVTINSSAALTTKMFYNCDRLQEITLNNSTTSIPNYCFQYCRFLKSITIPSSVTTIGSYAFNACRSLKYLTIPNNVTTIAANAFYSCYDLTTITIGSSVTSIGSGAFYECQSVIEYHFLSNTPPTLESSTALGYLSGVCKIYVPTGRRTTYMNATNYPSSSYVTYVEE